MEGGKLGRYLKAEVAALGRGWTLAYVLALVLALAGTVYCFSLAGFSRQSYVDLCLANHDPGGQGMSFFRRGLDTKRPWTRRWDFKFVAEPRFPQGPLPPDQINYRLDALGVFSLAQPGTVTFRYRVDDGLRLRIDGRTVLDLWEFQNVGGSFQEELAAGLHLLELDYFQGGDRATLVLSVLDGDLRKIQLHPLRQDFNAAHFGRIKEREYFGSRYLPLAAGAAGGLLFLAPAWLLLRGHRYWLPWLVARRRLLPGLVVGFFLALVSQGFYCLFKGVEQFPLRFVIAPLAGGLLGAVAQAAFLRLRPLPALAGRARDWYLAREVWLTPSFFFLAFAAIHLYFLNHLGAELPKAIIHAPMDAVHYRRIMAYGYILNFSEVPYFSGNAVWQPLFPLLARLFNLFLVNNDLWAPVVTSWTMSLVAFHLLWRVGARFFGPAGCRWSLLALGCYPGALYLFLGFPYGLAISLGCAYFLCLQRGRIWWAGLFGMGLAVSYATGMLIALLPLFMFAPRLWREADPGPALKTLLVTGGGPVLGVLLFCLHHLWRFHDFFLPFTAHTHWGVEAAWPWDSFLYALYAKPPDLGDLITFVLVVVGLIVFAWRLQPGLWAVTVALVLMTPLAGSIDSNYRQYLMAWPFFLLVGGSPRHWSLKVAFLWLQLYFTLAVYYPLWLSGKLI